MIIYLPRHTADSELKLLVDILLNNHIFQRVPDLVLGKIVQDSLIHNNAAVFGIFGVPEINSKLHNYVIHAIRKQLLLNPIKDPEIIRNLLSSDLIRNSDWLNILLNYLGSGYFDLAEKVIAKPSLLPDVQKVWLSLVLDRARKSGNQEEIENLFKDIEFHLKPIFQVHEQESTGRINGNGLNRFSRGRERPDIEASLSRSTFRGSSYRRPLIRTLNVPAKLSTHHHSRNSGRYFSSVFQLRPF
jgi:hypothetical protein